MPYKSESKDCSLDFKIGLLISELGQYGKSKRIGKKESLVKYMNGKIELFADT